jgi:hypothetical protein
MHKGKKKWQETVRDAKLFVPDILENTSSFFSGIDE